MKMELIYDSNLADMKRVIKLGGVKSMSRAINDSLAKGKTSLGMNIRAVYNIKKKDYAPYAKAIKCYPGNLQKGAIVVASRRFTSTHFSFTPTKYVSQKTIVGADGKKKKAKKYIASFTVKKNKKVRMPHIFVVNPNSPKLKGPAPHPLMLWKRYISKESGNENITPIRSLSVAQMSRQKLVYNSTVDVIEKTYEERLVDHLNRQFKVEK